MFEKKFATWQYRPGRGPGPGRPRDATPRTWWNSPSTPTGTAVPSFEGLSVGMTINAGNVEQFKEILDPAMFQQVKDGWVEIKVGETTSFDLHPNYVEATRKGLGQVSLGDKLGRSTASSPGGPSPRSRQPGRPAGR